MRHHDVCVAPVWCSADRDEAVLILQKAGIGVRSVRVAWILPFWEVRVDEVHRLEAQQLLDGKMLISYPFFKLDPPINRLLQVAAWALAALFLLLCLVTLPVVGASPSRFAIRVLSPCIAFLLLYYALRKPIGRIAHPAVQGFIWAVAAGFGWLLSQFCLLLVDLWLGSELFGWW